MNIAVITVCYYVFVTRVSSKLLASTSPILDMIFDHALSNGVLNVDSLPWSENFLSRLPDFYYTVLYVR